MDYYFDKMAHKDKLVEWIRSWFAENGPKSPAVLGVSGGKDSSVVAALCAEALGKDRVIGVLMPDGTQADIADSYEVVKALGIRYMTVDISGITTAAKEAIRVSGEKAVEEGTNVPTVFTDQMKNNLPPRVRMTTVYAISQAFDGRVANTCNMSETMVGWETRWGDAVGDFAPLAGYTATEVMEIGTVLPLPGHLAKKAPSDGLCGRTDEDAMGFTYAVLDRYLRTGFIDSAEDKEKIDRRIKANRFKRRPIPGMDPGLPRWAD